MKSSLLFLALLAIALVAGCRSHRSAPNQPEGAHNMWANRWYQDAAQERAVIRQATVFSGQFHPGSAELTGVGARDLDVLIEHYGEVGGEISVRRGDASEALYAARVATVANAFVAAGVPEGHVVITSNLPAGAGLTSEQARDAVEEGGAE